LALACALLGGFWLHFSARAEDETFSRANTLLFLNDHLANVEQPTTLRYSFESRGPGEEGFTDTIDVRVVEVWPDGSKRVEMDYFTGKRNRPVPAVDHARGNPVVMLFLQRDVMEMARRSPQTWRYFQKQIKIALQDRVELASGDVDHAGRRIQAQTITIQPYLHTDAGPGWERYRTKTYRFTLSQDIPGTIYEIRSVSGQPSVGEAILTYTPTAVSSRPVQSSTR
jgi:hypothetical protein